MARTPRETPADLIRADDEIQIRPEVVQALALVDADNAQRQGRANALATEVQYDGDLTVSALDDGIRFYLRRTVEDCLELGKRLLLRRELTPHGEWLRTLEAVGIAQPTADRFMQAAIKTAKSPNLGNLVRHAKNPSAMLELLVLDDGQAEALLAGQTIAELHLDEIETAPASVLRRRLRDALADNAAKDKVLADKAETIDRQATELAKRSQGSMLIQVAVADPDAQGEQLRRELATRVFRIERDTRADLRLAIDALIEHARAQGEEVHDLIAGHLAQLAGAVDDLRFHYRAFDAPSGRRTEDADIWDAVNASTETAVDAAADADQDVIN